MKKKNRIKRTSRFLKIPESMLYKYCKYKNLKKKDYWTSTFIAHKLRMDKGDSILTIIDDKTLKKAKRLYSPGILIKYFIHSSGILSDKECTHLYKKIEYSKFIREQLAREH